jgi:hypothetical protein
MLWTVFAVLLLLLWLLGLGFHLVGDQLYMPLFIALALRSGKHFTMDSTLIQAGVSPRTGLRPWVGGLSCSEELSLEGQLQ